MRWSIVLVALAAALPGCTWFDRGGESSGEWQGPSIPVAVQVDGPRDVRVHLTISQLGTEAAAVDFVAKAGETTERTLPIDTTAINVVRASYTMDSAGRAATGSAEARYDPSTCPSGFRITFKVVTGEDIASAGSTGVCEGQQPSG